MKYGYHNKLFIIILQRSLNESLTVNILVDYLQL